MKRFAVLLLSSLLFLEGCSSSSPASSPTPKTEPSAEEAQKSVSDEKENKTNKETISSSSETDTSSTTNKDSNNQIFESKSSKAPDDILLMSYAQTVLDNFLPNCKYSRNISDYNFVETDLRYKIEGKVSVNSSSSSEDFWMIIQFLDDNYETYDLILLEIGSEVIYESENPSNTNPISPADENGILSEENQKIYSEVMNKLNSDYTRDEDEIFEEIAPYYGMSASELKQFMYDYMEAYYQ